MIVSYLNETAKMVESAIGRYIHTSDSTLQSILDDALKPKGNRERPLLVRLSCEAVGGRFADIIPAAVAVELLHFSTLVIDDILDNAPLRGNVKTIQAAYGANISIIIGELLSSLALLALTNIANDKKDEYKLLEVVKVFKKTQNDLYYGQYLDYSFEHNEHVDENQYINMVSNTTSSLIKCSVITGSILGGGNADQIECLSRYGESLGIGFQIRDDIIDIIGDTSLIGKQLGGDIRQGKMRLPFIHALSNTKGIEGQFLKKVLKKRNVSADDVAECIKILINNGSIEYSKKIMNHFCQKAIKCLDNLPNSQAEDALIAFAKVIASSW